MADAAEDRLVNSLVIDAGPLIKGGKPGSISPNVYSVKEVIAEIRDPNTRQSLSVLPYELRFREPAESSIKAVSAFARKTGDYSVLSLTDLKLLALVHQLQVESGADGAAAIRSEPLMTCGATTSSTAISSGTTAGFFMPTSADEHQSDHGKGTAPVCDDAHGEGTASVCGDTATTVVANGGATNVVTVGEASSNEMYVDQSSNEHRTNSLADDGVEDSDGEAGKDSCDDDGGGWVTPDNFARVKKSIGGGQTVNITQPMPVACMTTDFAMQNVLLQMGLPVISVDGMLVREVRTYVLRCTACFKVTSQSNNGFCPKCGNDTLARVSMHVDSNGQKTYGSFHAKRLNARGLKYSLPLPKGGRFAVNPILAPDQRVTYKPPRSRTAPLDALNPDYLAGESPFAFNDVTSRGVNIAFQKKSSSTQRNVGPGQRRVNPNASKGKRRKK